MARASAWYETAFGRGYLAVYPHRDLAAARAEVRELVRQGLGGRTLDLGCGFGRHVLALREAGVEAFGLDLSAELLAHASEHQRCAATSADVAGRLARGDFRRLPFRDGAFASTCMLFSSFGYLDDEANARVLGEVRRVLAPRGNAVFDLMNPARVRAELVPRSEREREGFRLVERRTLAEDGRRVVKDVRLEPLQGAGSDGARGWHEDVRLYEPHEFERLARGAALEVERVAGDFDGRAFGPASPRQIVWARAR